MSSDGIWQVIYDIVGDLDQIVIPAAGPAERRDQLWRHTCCELFCKSDGATGYREFNFSPSTAWAAYQFGGYRAGQRDATLRVAPAIQRSSHAGRLRLVVKLAMQPVADRQLIGCSAVIENVDGTLTFWALAHPSAAPDFHHPDSFARWLPSVEVLT
jgi:hypothetical protein